MFALPLVAVLALASQVAGAPSGRHSAERRAVPHNELAAAVQRAPKPGRHDYLLNSTLAARGAQARAASGSATYYHPEWEGESAVGSCGGQAMNDHTMGVALSSPGWAYFASQGLSKQDLCWKTITIEGSYGVQKAQIMDTCPSHGPTGTCFDICDIDLTYGLFGMLDNHDRGIVPIKWSFDDGTPNPCGNNKGAANNNNNNNNNGGDRKKESKPSWSAPSSKPKPKPSSSAWSEPKASWTPSSSQAQSKTKQHIASASSSPTPSSTAASKDGFKTQLQWWAEVDTQWCSDFKAIEGVPAVAVGPNEAFPGDKLKDTCGKWITIVNEEGKKSEAQVGMWLPGHDSHYLAVASAFRGIIDNGASPTVTWSFNDN